MYRERKWSDHFKMIRLGRMGYGVKGGWAFGQTGKRENRWTLLEKWLTKKNKKQNKTKQMNPKKKCNKDVYDDFLNDNTVTRGTWHMRFVYIRPSRLPPKKDYFLTLTTNMKWKEIHEMALMTHPIVNCLVWPWNAYVEDEIWGHITCIYYLWT